jgi:hypothetical protein
MWSTVAVAGRGDDPCADRHDATARWITLSRRTRMHAPRRSLVALLMLAGIGATAQGQTIDLRSTTGGFTASTIGTPGGTEPNNPWTWTSGEGWRVNGRTNTARQRLLSGTLTAAGGAFSVTAVHRFNFESFLGGAPPTCFDGGQVLGSINGGAFGVLAPASGVGYTASIAAGFNNPLTGAAFCGASAGYDARPPQFISSTWSGTLAGGTTLALALDGGWDMMLSEANPNWQLVSVSLSGFGPVTVVPEPSVVLLLFGGMTLMWATRMRKRV